MECREEGDERRNGKQQCNNVSSLAESVVKKQRQNTEEKWYHLISTPYMLSVWLPCQRTSNCLALYIVKQLQQGKEEQYTWCRAETKKTRNKMMRDEFYTFYLTKKRRSKTMKDEFFASYLKKNSTPLQSRLINYYQNEERDANVNDYPSIHMILRQSSGGIMMDNKMIIIFNIERIGCITPY